MTANKELFNKVKNARDVSQFAVNGELSAIEEAIRQNVELSKHLEDSANMLADQTMSVIDSMGLVFDQKKECIDKLRSWRKSIELEACQAGRAVDSISENLNQGKLAEFREFVELTERLNKINPGVLVGKLFE
jgi:hypothetical protein